MTIKSSRFEKGDHATMHSASFLVIMSLVAVVAASGLAFLAYNDEVGRARAAVAKGGRIANTATGPIEYAVAGVGIPLLSIHGAGGGYDQGLDIAKELIGGGFRVIAPSRFGYLGTPLPSDVSPSAQADAHAALLAALKVDKVIVVGTSAGALSAIELALQHPNRVAALILIVPAIYAPTSPVAIEASRGSRFAFWLVNAGTDFAWWITEKIAPSMLIRFIGVPSELLATASPTQRERAMRTVRKIQPLSARIAGINIDSKPVQERPPLEMITTPTMVISSQDDLFNTVPAAEFAAATIPNAMLVVYDKGGHLLVGHELEIRALVGDFLAKAGIATIPQ